ncbi:hypothetical protein [Paenibacillus sp. MMS20-IR301]|uniref:hypothetical protein n=1 Tax=Paenibacillus sp. MMS20-IR301 TaxID=2895946 RepID=UPI0028E64733|nr:hypothetical protein [Paenibacillus sp. MMS20-IR301]WNS45826.1 hypothetical protein LOS79_11320 [Paenibacillus sp. MMS20-IR301]
MYTKKMILMLSLVLAVFSVSACSNEGENAAPEAVQALAAPQPASGNAPDTADPVDAGENKGLPDNLPADFPLPEDAVISLSHSEDNEGRKAALLIFTTKESMDSVSKLYKDYLSSRLGSDSAQTIDDKNLIIQGTTKDNKQSWSIIGGSLASQEGVIELNVTWAEM